MAKRVYIESVKAWAKGLGISGVSLFGLIFMYLLAVGSISNVSYSGDMICEGTIDDPCYAYINFTANEDIFIYPTGYDPWGRDTLFNFAPEVKSWRLERSWGNGWRNIPIDTTCTGTWCGAKDSSGDCLYSVAFRKDRDYKIRIVAYKNNPTDTLKWGAFSGVDEIDPFWYGVNTTTETSVTTSMNIELGTAINISTNLTGATTVCVDIDHPEYGDNYTCGTPTANFIFNISYFSENEFNDSSTTKTINTTDLIFYVAAHQYDEVQNFTINLTGINTASNVSVYVNGTLSNSLGFVYNTSNGDIDETAETSLDLLNGDSTTFSIPKGATVTNTTLNFTGVNDTWLIKYNAIPETTLGEFDTPSDGIAYWDDALENGFDGNIYSRAVMFNSPAYDIAFYGRIYENYTLEEDALITSLTSYFNSWPNAPFLVQCWSGSWTNVINDTSAGQSASEQETATVPSACLAGSVLQFKTTLKYDATGVPFVDYWVTYLYENTFNYYRYGYPENMSIEVGIVDGIKEYQGSGELTGSNYTDSFVSEVNTYLDTCAADENGYCDVPIYFTSDDGGKLTIDNFKVSYTYDINPVSISSSMIQNFLDNSTDDVNIPISFSLDEGSFSVSGLQYNHKGGNDTIEILTWDDNNTITLKNNFNNSLTIENLTYTGDEDITRWLSLPKNTAVTNGSFNLTGYFTKNLSKIEDLNDSFEKDGSNTDAWGMTNDGTYIWIVDATGAEVYKYWINGTYTGTHFDTAASGNAAPIGITQNGTYIWVTDFSDDLVYKYTMDGTSTGDSFAIEGAFAYGITQDGTYFWTVDAAEHDVYKYWMNGTYTGSSFSTGGTFTSFGSGLTHDGTYLWIGCDIDDNKVRKLWTNGTDTGDFFISSTACVGITQNVTYFWTNHYSASDVYKYGVKDSYPSDIYVSIDGTRIFEQAGDFKTNNETSNIATTINNYISTATEVGGNYLIPFLFHSDTPGILKYSNINITGVYTSKSNNDTLNLFVYYSSLFKNLPYTWASKIFFIPKTNSSKNVTAYGQTTTVPIYNITTTNYGGNSNFSIKVNESFSCLNLTWSNNATKNESNIINTTWQILKSNVEYLNNTQLWLWADFDNCNASDQRILQPSLEIEGYCVDCEWI